MATTLTNGTLHKKLFEIQKIIQNPRKNTEGYGYQYANLEQVLNIIKPLLFENDILLQQTPCSDNDRVGVQTTLKDLTTGEEIINVFHVELIKKDIQAVGSYLTYLRRYTLLAIFGMAPVDDDGKSAMPEPQKKTEPKTLTQPTAGNFKIPEGRLKGKRVKDLTAEEVMQLSVFVKNHEINELPQYLIDTWGNLKNFQGKGDEWSLT